MNFGHASNGPDFDTDLSRNVNLTLDRFGKFDLALFQRLAESSQLLAVHRVVLSDSSASFVIGAAVTFR
jgi:hypothetical protein